MILKYMSNFENGKNPSWYLISEITSLKYRSLTEKEKEELLSSNKTLNSVIQDKKAYTSKYIQAWHKRSSDPINIVTDMPIYVLNDEGKTVERII